MKHEMIDECLGDDFGDDDHESSNQSSALNQLKAKQEAQQKLAQLVKNQNIDGSWDDDAGNYGIMGLSQSSVLKQTPEKIKDIQVWVTMLVLVYIAKAFAAQRSSWQLIYKKGVEWLKEKNIDLEEYRSIALSVLKL